MTFADIITNVRINLDDTAAIKHSADELQDSLQDAYDDIAFQARCIVKKTTLSWVANSPYLDFRTGIGGAETAVADYLATTAIYDNNQRLFLLDNLSLRDLNAKMEKWENYSGAPQYWGVSDVKRIFVHPYPPSAVGNFDLYYWATAPTVSWVTPSAVTPVIAPDMHDLFEYYATADLLCSLGQYTDSRVYWTRYFATLKEYANRSKELAKADLLRILAR